MKNVHDKLCQTAYPLTRAIIAANPPNLEVNLLWDACFAEIDSLAFLTDITSK